MKGKIKIWKLVTGVILVGLGAYFIYGAVFIMPQADKDWSAASVSTTGEVIDLRETYRNKAYCEYAIIRYTTSDNRILTFTPYGCFSKGTFKVGSRVKMRYSMKDASVAFIDTGENDNSTSLITIVMAVILIACGVVLMAGSVKNEEKQV